MNSYATWRNTSCSCSNAKKASYLENIVSSGKFTLIISDVTAKF